MALLPSSFLFFSMFISSAPKLPTHFPPAPPSPPGSFSVSVFLHRHVPTHSVSWYDDKPSMNVWYAENRRQPNNSPSGGHTSGRRGSAAAGGCVPRFEVVSSSWCYFEASTNKYNRHGSADVSVDLYEELRNSTTKTHEQEDKRPTTTHNDADHEAGSQQRRQPTRMRQSCRHDAGSNAEMIKHFILRVKTHLLGPR